MNVHISCLSSFKKGHKIKVILESVSADGIKQEELASFRSAGDACEWAKMIADRPGLDGRFQKIRIL